MIPTIYLPRKKVKKFKFEDKEFLLVIDALTINHFQKSNKKGFLKLVEELQDAEKNKEVPIFEIIQLLGSCMRYATGNPVTTKFFKDYDDFAVAEILMPELQELFDDNMPKAKDDSEKK